MAVFVRVCAIGTAFCHPPLRTAKQQQQQSWPHLFFPQEMVFICVCVCECVSLCTCVAGAHFFIPNWELLKWRQKALLPLLQHDKCPSHIRDIYVLRLHTQTLSRTHTYIYTNPGCGLYTHATWIISHNPHAPISFRELACIHPLILHILTAVFNSRSEGWPSNPILHVSHVLLIWLFERGGGSPLLLNYWQATFMLPAPDPRRRKWWAGKGRGGEIVKQT